MIASVNLPTRRKYKSFSPRSRPQIIVPADMAAYERLTNDVYVHGSVSLALAMAQETGMIKVLCQAEGPLTSAHVARRAKLKER